jgi:phospholipid/cholesterol/gamma-HCH transport system substrate-binding protein
VRNIRAIEFTVGLFILAGIFALLVLALKVSGLGTAALGGNGYYVTANFDNIGGLKVRAPVTIAGVHVGEVTNIHLDPTTYRATVTLLIDQQQNQLPSDTSASIYTQGLLGANYISLAPGYDTTYLKNGAVLQSTHPALILEDLIGQLLFSLKDKATGTDANNASAATAVVKK